MSLPPPQLDHLVFGGPDLAQAVGLVAELTGVAAVAGGRHPEHGTANYLIGIGHGAYLEIIGPDPRAAEPARPRWLGLDALAAPRLLTWALRSPDLAASVAAARARGYDPGQSRSMSRLADDGTRLVWQLTPTPSPPGMGWCRSSSTGGRPHTRPPATCRPSSCGR